MKYIFGYGSIMNSTSLAKTLPGKRDVRKATLLGYQRKINAPVNGYLYMNLVPNKKVRVEGVLVSVTDKELQLMKPREPGYNMMDVTDFVEESVGGEVIAFIAPDKEYPGLQIPKSYLETCTRDLGVSTKERWLQETIIENPILDDLENPVYINAAF